MTEIFVVLCNHTASLACTRLPSYMFLSTLCATARLRSRVDLRRIILDWNWLKFLMSPMSSQLFKFESYQSLLLSLLSVLQLEQFSLSLKSVDLILNFLICLSLFVYFFFLFLHSFFIFCMIWITLTHISERLLWTIYTITLTCLPDQLFHGSDSLLVIYIHIMPCQLISFGLMYLLS